MTDNPYYGPIPRLTTMRRVPSRYHHIVPLEVMKHYRFVVVGAARGTLTVAILDQQQKPMIDSLSKLTGHTIFPVFVDHTRMRLLIERIERCERRTYRKLLGCPYYLHRIQLQSIIHFLSFMNEY